jgi:sugar lactone lactonase YvrE
MRTLRLACLLFVGCGGTSSLAASASSGDAGVPAPTGTSEASAPSSEGGDDAVRDAAVGDGAVGDGGTNIGVDLCPDGFPRGTAGAPRLVAALSPAPEGVAVCASGDVFVSIPDQAKILRVPLTGGEPEVWTTLTGRQPLGMTCVGNVLYVVDFRSKDAAVMRILAKDDPGTALPNIDGDNGYSALNAIVSVPGVGLFASDASNTLSGRLVRFAETAPGVFQASVAKTGIAFPNGVAFDPKSNVLDVALTLTSSVVSYPVGNDGTLGKGATSWTGTPVADAIDGIARDENQAIYVAHYLQGYVGRSSDKAKIASAKSPKSLAFRGGTLLFTSDAGLNAVDLGVCGSQP